MTPRIIKIQLLRWNLPMKQIFITARGQKTESRNLLVKIRLSDETTGIGEASASLAWPDQTQAAMSRALSGLKKDLIGKPISKYPKLIRNSWKKLSHYPTAAAALECALRDAFALTNKTSLWKQFGGKKRSVTTALTISAWPTADAARAVRSAYQRGFRTFKIKLTGRDADGDLQRIQAVHAAAPRARLWLDANQGFRNAAATLAFMKQLDRSWPVDLLEQPVPKKALTELKKVTQALKIPVCADESARSAADARKIIRKKAASAVCVKLAKSGLSGALEIIAMARKAHLKLMISCMAESAIGLWPSVALACGTGAFDFIDLDSHLLVKNPGGNPGFKTEGSRLTVLSRNG